jgi:hypothetical protein
MVEESSSMLSLLHIIPHPLMIQMKLEVSMPVSVDVNVGRGNGFEPEAKTASGLILNRVRFGKGDV